ncbi:MAG: hypothetical protein NTAFB05_06790 [Nitrobacter sp.]
MEAPPPSAFIKLDKMIKPPFGDAAPAIENVLGLILNVLSGARGVGSLGHGRVRKEENGRRRNERIIQRLLDILWKTSAKSSTLRHECDAFSKDAPPMRLSGGNTTAGK